ncbi:MAG: hypothetical protein Q4B28_01840 [bacterium]|nr:hypothetical protein [bacterium]
MGGSELPEVVRDKQVYLLALLEKAFLRNLVPHSDAGFWGIAKKFVGWFKEGEAPPLTIKGEIPYQVQNNGKKSSSFLILYQKNSPCPADIPLIERKPTALLLNSSLYILNYKSEGGAERSEAEGA